MLEDSWKMGFYVHKLPVGCVIVNAWPLNEWLPLENGISLGDGDPNRPRIFCARYSEWELVIRLRWLPETRTWACDAAKRESPGQTMRHLLEKELPKLEFGNQVSLGNLHMKISMREESVFRKNLMVIDLRESLVVWAKAETQGIGAECVAVTVITGVLGTSVACVAFLGRALLDGTYRTGLGVVVNL